MRSFFLIVVLFVARPAFAQYFGFVTSSSRSISLGRSDIADTRDEWNPNPALPADTSSNVRVDFSPQPIAIPQSYDVGVSGDIPLDGSSSSAPNWTAGAAFSLYQWLSLWSYESLGAQVSRTFRFGSDSTSRKATVGLRLRYTQQTYGQSSDPSIAYAPVNDLSFDLGASFDLLHQLTLAVTGTHLVTLSNNQDIAIEWPAALIGVSYRATSDFTVDAAFESSVESHPEFHAGAEYALDENVLVRAGDDLQTGLSSTNEIMAGLGVVVQNLRLDFAVNRHSDLGPFVSFDLGLAL